MTVSKAELAKTIDHAILRPEMTPTDVVSGCETADRLGVASVCVRPCDVLFACEQLAQSKVEVGTVIGFPHGASESAVKFYESHLAIEQGATELDIVVNIGHMRAGQYDRVETELGAIVQAAKVEKVLTKIIFENCYLTNEQKRTLCAISVKVGADFVKTSTGFGTSGATLEDIALMKKAVTGKAKLKAAGGISDLETALLFIEAGCERIGCSATEKILASLPDSI
jgi:deoxyribose-phosphate aldolase